MNWTRARRVSGVFLLAASLVVLAWSLWPQPGQARSLAISPADMRPVELPSALPAIAQERSLSLEWPQVVRAGEMATVRLVFDSTAGGSQSPPVSPRGNEYTVLAEARLELPGIPHTPQGEVSQALLPGRPAKFVWDLMPVVAGEAQGTVWLHLRFISTAGPDLRQVLTAQRIDIRVVDFMGLSGPWARALGSAGAAVGAALCLDGVVLWLWRQLEARKGVS